MKYTISYIATPALIWCLIPREQINIITSKGIIPKSKNIFGIKQLKRKKVLYAVRAGDEDAFIRLVKMLDEPDAERIEAAVPAYYKCISESPETVPEQQEYMQYGPPHKNIFIIPTKIKPKYIYLPSLPEMPDDESSEQEYEDESDVTEGGAILPDPDEDFYIDRQEAAAKIEDYESDFADADEYFIEDTEQDAEFENEPASRGPELSDAMKALGLTQADLDRMKTGE